MGISRRNPRGNFNWQSRILKKKAQCCGQLNELVDCDLNAPILSIIGNIICITDPVSPSSMTCTNTRPGQAVATLYEWYKGSLADPPYYSSYGPVSTLVFITPSLSLEDTWFVKATNEFGCVTIEEFYVYTSLVPDFTYNVGTPTLDCVVDPLSPSGYSSDGSIDIVLTNPDPLAIYYGYVITYSPLSVANPNYTQEITSGLSSFSFDDLCPGSYTITVNVYRTIDGSPSITCSSSQQIQLGPLILEWDNIANTSSIGVFDPYDLFQWKMAFNAYNLTKVDVVGNSVYLYSTTTIDIPANRFFNNSHILNVYDLNAYVNIVYYNAFQSCSSIIAVEFPYCTDLGYYSFAGSSVSKAVFTRLTKVTTHAFDSTASLVAYDFSNVKLIEEYGFYKSGILNIDFPNLITVNDFGLTELPNADAVSCPNLQFIGNSGMGGNPFMGSSGTVSLPSLVTGLNDCLSTNATLVGLDLPNMVTAGAGAFQLNPEILSISAPNLISLGNIGCKSSKKLAYFDVSSIVDIGVDPLDNGVFLGITSGFALPHYITVLAPTAQQTSNAGGLEGDLDTLNTNCIVTFIWT